MMVKTILKNASMMEATAALVWTKTVIIVMEQIAYAMKLGPISVMVNIFDR